MLLVEYLKSSKAELEKVSWPSRQDTIRYSALVVAASIVVAVFFAAMDFGLGKSVEGLLGRGMTQEQLVEVAPVQVEGITPSGETVPLNITPVK